MADKEVTQDEVNQLIEDAAYLQGEADALQYVIESVPYNESPPDKRSIAEILLLIDHAQTSYYRPILEEAAQQKRPVRLAQFTDFRETFELEGEVGDIQKVLRKISKHRAGLVNSIENISLIDWENVIYDGNKELFLFDFMQQMIHFERRMLKDIADQVMVFSSQQQSKREIEKRRKQRNQAPPSSDNDNHS